MQEEDRPNGSLLSEEEAQGVLRRAIAFEEAQRRLLSVDEVRMIAEELDVSPAAFDRALRGDDKPEPKPLLRRLGLRPGPVTLLALGCLMPFAVQAAPSATRYLYLASYALIMLNALGLRGTGRFARVFLGATAFWVGFFAGAAFLQSAPSSAMAVLIRIATSTVAAMAAIAIRDIISGRSNSGSSAKPDQGEGLGSKLWLRLLKIGSRWLGDGPLQRMWMGLAATHPRG